MIDLMENDLAIVILNYNGAAWLEKFLLTFISNSPRGSIYVIDNGSTDLSLEVLKKWPEVYIINLDANYGFCGGYNQGIKQIDKKYLILVNSDVEVTSGWFTPLLEKIANPLVGACQPKVLDYNNKNRFEYAGAAGGMMDAWSLPYCHGRTFTGTLVDTHQFEKESKIFWASGACMAIQREVFEAIGGFDELFFAHMEEIDLCWRLQIAGYEIWYTPKSTIFHVGGGTLSAQSPKKTFLNHRNNLFTIYKNYGKGKFALLTWRLILDGAIGCYYLFTKGPRHVMAVIKAHIDFYKLHKKLIVTNGKGKKYLSRKRVLLS